MALELKTYEGPDTPRARLFQDERRVRAQNAC